MHNKHAVVVIAGNEIQIKIHSDSEYFIDPRGEILFIPTAPCKVEMETSDKEWNRNKIR